MYTELRGALPPDPLPGLYPGPTRPPRPPSQTVQIVFLFSLVWRPGLPYKFNIE